MTTNTATNSSRKYYPTALALYITYFVLGISASIMGQYKQNFADLWGASQLRDGSYDVSGVVAVIAAIGLGRLLAFPVAGPLSDRLGRRLSALIGCVLYAIFLICVTFTSNMYLGYALAIISGMANSFLDTSITPSCMEIFKEKGTVANMFTKLSVSIAQFAPSFSHRLCRSARASVQHAVSRRLRPSSSSTVFSWPFCHFLLLRER